MRKSNVDTIRDVIEQVVNQKKIEAWDEFFSPEYVAHGAPFIGMGFGRVTSGNKHIINMVFPDSPAERKLWVGDEILWVADDQQCWESFEEIEEGLKGRSYKLGVKRGDQTLEVELTRAIVRGYDTHTAQAKSEMREFMTNQFPDLTATIQQIIADGDRVVSLLEYRGTHKRYQREAVWQEAWFVRMSEGMIVESWPINDLYTYFRHLGYQLVPPGK